MKSPHAIQVAAGVLLAACNDVTRPTTAPEIAPNLNLAAAVSAQGWLGGELQVAEVGVLRAEHSQDIPCGVFVTPTGPAVATTGHLTVSSSGNASLICKGELPASIPAPEGGAVVFSGVPCGVPVPGGFVVTSQSHNVITPSGKVHLTCHVHPGA